MPPTKRLTPDDIDDEERRKCARVATVDFERLVYSIARLQDAMRPMPKDQVKTLLPRLWKADLETAKEMVLIAQSLLQFLELNDELEELSKDVDREILPRIEEMLDVCVRIEELDDTQVRKEGDVPRIAHQLKTVRYCMKEVIDMVFKDTTSWLKTPERYQLLNACQVLFTASREVVTYVVESKSCLADPKDLEALDHYMEQAIACCEDTELDDYEFEDEQKEAGLDQELAEEDSDDELADDEPTP